jgi:hypothetical protein
LKRSIPRNLTRKTGFDFIKRPKQQKLDDSKEKTSEYAVIYKKIYSIQNRNLKKPLRILKERVKERRIESFSIHLYFT